MPPDAVLDIEVKLLRIDAGQREVDRAMTGRLIRRSRLRRAIEFNLPDGPHVVEYDGHGIGYEQVTVDGIPLRRVAWLWFVPRFEFKVGGRPGVVEVRVWPWVTLRSLALRVGGRIVYAEGFAGDGKPALSPDGWDELA